MCMCLIWMCLFDVWHDPLHCLKSVAEMQPIYKLFSCLMFTRKEYLILRCLNLQLQLLWHFPVGFLQRA